MNPERYVVLRSPSLATRGSSGPLDSDGEGASGTPADTRVELEEISTQDDIRELTNDPGVLSAAPVMPLKLHEPAARNILDDEEGPTTWGIRAVGADTTPYDGRGVTVAILDTGIDSAHPAFAGIDIVEKDFTDEGNGDREGHGTHCAGTVFGHEVNGLRIGVAPGIERALIGKVLDKHGDGSTEGIASAISWALEERAHIISMSLGIDFPGQVARWQAQGLPPEPATSRALEGYRANIDLFTSLAGLARTRGNASIIIAAAGNESRRNQNPAYEIAAAPPAAANGVISVGALGRSPDGLRVAGFSNTRPQVSGPGVGVQSASTGGGLTTMDGTSMATPHVVGVAALWAESLRSTMGSIEDFALRSKLLAHARIDELATPFNQADIGTGMVHAP